MLRILLAIMVMTFLFAVAAVWAIFEFDLFMVKGPEFVSRWEAEPKPARSRLSRGRVARRAPAPGAIPAYDLTGRSFGRSPLPLSLPIDCEPGVDCWVFNYVDSDPGKGYADFACGRMSYDGHKGTDIALAHAGRLHERIEVRAAADGRVVGVRDGMSDLDVRLIGRAALKGKDCGNGVRIDHGEGWHTQYCHMKRGSVSVRRGNRVRAGERLGAVGLSGRTEFSHLHISVEKKGKVVDPFVGVEGGAECDLGKTPLWRREVLEKLRYLSTIPYQAGFADHLPTTEEVRTGALGAKSLPASSHALVFWAEVAGLMPGDFISLRLLGPDGGVLAQKKESLKRHRIRIWRAVGKRTKVCWPPGAYRGEVRIMRETRAGPREALRGVKLRVLRE